MLSQVENFWLRWHVEHSNDELATRAQLVLEAETGESTGDVAANLGLSAQTVAGVLAEFEQARLATFPRAKVRLEQLINLDTPDARGRQYLARQVRRLFNDTRPLHHLPRQARPLLETAALLPPVEPSPAAGHSTQPAPLLLDGAILADLSPTDQTMVALVLQMQHRGFRVGRDSRFTQLRPYLQSQVRYLAALLQVGVLLDHSQTHTTSLKGAELLGDAVELRLLGSQATADGSYACRHAWLWQPVFHCGLRHTLGPRTPAMARQAEPAAPRDEPVGEAFSRQMAAGLRTWQSSQPGALAGELAGLTDLQAGIDQVRAALGAFGSMLKRRPVKAVKHSLSRLHNLLADYLAGQAALADLNTYLAGRTPAAAAELQPMREAWERNGRRQLAAVRAKLSEDGAAVLAAVEQLAAKPPVRPRKDATLHVAAPVLLDELCAEVAEREAQVIADQPNLYRRYQNGLARLACALEALGGKAAMGEEAEALLADLLRMENRIDRWLGSNVLNEAVAAFLDDWAEQQARRKAPQLFGAQAVLAYRQARKAQWFRLRSSLVRDWRPLRAARLRRRANTLLKQLTRHPAG